MPKARVESFAIELVSLTGTYRRSTGDVVQQQGRGPRMRLKLSGLEPLPGEALAPTTETVELLFFYSADEFGPPTTGRDLGVSRWGNSLSIYCVRDDFDRTWQLVRSEDTVFLFWTESSDGSRSENWALSTDGESHVRVWARPAETPIRDTLEPARVLADILAGSLLRGVTLPGVSDGSGGAEGVLGKALIESLRGRRLP